MSLDVRDPACRRCKHPAAQHVHYSSATRCALRDCTCTAYLPVMFITRILDRFRSTR